MLPGFLTSHERDESTTLFRDMKKRAEKKRRPNFLPPACKRGVLVLVMMEPLVYLLVTTTTTTLTSDYKIVQVQDLKILIFGKKGHRNLCIFAWRWRKCLHI